MREKRYPEVTWSCMAFGIALGILLNTTITYAGLKIGFTITGSAVAAVLGFGVLRALLRRGTILEVNMAQTVASTVNTTTSGIIFTAPVLFLLNPEFKLSDPKLWLITLACSAGAVLGCLFIVPLRKQMIEIDRLRFPTGTAMGAILRAPGAGGKKSLVLVLGAVIGAAIYYPTSSPSLKWFEHYLLGYEALEWRLPAPRPADENSPEDTERFRSEMHRVDHYPDEEHKKPPDGKPDLVLEGEEFHLGRWLGLPDYLAFTFAIAPLSFGAGYITGRPGLMVLAGGLLAYWVLAPAAYLSGLLPSVVQDFEVADAAREAMNRPLGIGMLVGGAFMGIVAALPAMRAAFKSIASASKMHGEKDEMDLRLLVAIATPCVLLLLAGAWLTRTPNDTGWLSGLPFWLQNVLIVGFGAVWIWFAGIIIAQCTGMTDWSPISGIALLTVVLVLLLGGTSDHLGAVLFGATICVAVTAAADMMTDLKTGQLVGAVPRKQQLMQTITAAIGPFVSMATLLLIITTNRAEHNIPIGEGTPTTAPQAQALKAIITGVQGGEIPYVYYGSGAVFGTLLGLGAFSGLGVLVGISMYLPLMYILTYGLGCITNMICARVKGEDWAEEWGVPFCAGLIVGEGLLQLAVNGLILLLPQVEQLVVWRMLKLIPSYL